MTEKHAPYNEFKGFLRSRKLTYRDIAQILGLSVTSVGKKINGESDFLLSEVEILKRELQPNRDIFL